jgi:hypothetical protein
MSDHEHARLMLRMAEKDHTALQGMLDTQIFAEEDEPLDRLAMIQQVTELMDHVKQLLVDTEEDIEQ